jgi:PTS system nitrogen regulatory IIA component
MDIEQLASYLSRDVREVGRLASRGDIPGRKVGGEWRFARAEINHWITNRLHECSPEELAALESAHAASTEEPLLANLLRESTISVPLPATTRSSVLREMVKLAEQSWVVYDADAVLEGIVAREAMSTTALPGGVALPHPPRPLGPAILGESVVAFGRTSTGIPFGAPRGLLTDLFFLVCCTDDRTHLRVLARIMRLLRREGMLDSLRAAQDATEARELLVTAEEALLAAEA